MGMVQICTKSNFCQVVTIAIIINFSQMIILIENKKSSEKIL